jgi:hypothetical protein
LKDRAQLVIAAGEDADHAQRQVDLEGATRIIQLRVTSSVEGTLCPWCQQFRGGAETDRTPQLVDGDGHGVGGICTRKTSGPCVGLHLRQLQMEIDRLPSALAGDRARQAASSAQPDPPLDAAPLPRR